MGCFQGLRHWPRFRRPCWLILAALFVFCLDFSFPPRGFSQVPGLDKNDQPSDSSKPQQQEGITREQADAILSELRLVRHLLEQKSQPQDLAPISEKVQMGMAGDWHVMGRPEAPVTIVEFTDLQCAFCKRFHAETFPLLKEEYIDTGKVRFISRDMPLEFHRHAFLAAKAARCAGEQGKYWEMRHTILESAEEPTEELVSKRASTLVSDSKSFQSCLNSQKYQDAIQKDLRDAEGLQIYGTPTFVVGMSTSDKLDGILMVGAQTIHEFQSAVDQLLETVSPTAK